VCRHDIAGRTALHCAAIQQECSICQLLAEAKADCQIKDCMGHSALDIAHLNGWNMPLREDETTDERQAKMQKTLPDPQSVVALNPEQVDSKTFSKNFIAIRRPAILRDMARSFLHDGCGNLRTCWTLAGLAARAGASQIEVGTIPYADDFGINSGELLTTLERFVDVELNIFACSGVPYYLFAFVDDTLQPLLSTLIRDELNGIPEHLPSPFEKFNACALQFALGSNGSGSPHHFHDDAFNILLTGRKKWWMWPPALAAMSSVHPSRLTPEDMVGALEVVQKPGDIVYVPNGWGHAVLNLEYYTMCVAVEFQE